MKPIYTEAGIDGFEGQLVMGVEVDANGGASSVTVVKSPDSKLTEVATAALMQGKYKPAICKEQPCAVTFFLHIDLLRRENTSTIAGGFR